MKTANRALTM